MSVSEKLAIGIVGFALAQSFNVASNPLGSQGFLESTKRLVTQPAVVAYGAMERPGGVLGPLGIAAVILVAKRRREAVLKPD